MSDSPAAILFDITGNAVGVTVDGSVYRLLVQAKSTPASNANRTSVVAAMADTLLVSSNLNRISVIIYNDSDSPLYIGLGTTAVTVDDFTFFVSSQSEIEIPIYFVGELRGIWQNNTVNGFARITETS